MSQSRTKFLYKIMTTLSSFERTFFLNFSETEIMGDKVFLDYFGEIISIFEILSWKTLDCKKHSSSGFNRLIHLAIHHKALQGLIPEKHWSNKPIKLIYKKAAGKGCRICPKCRTTRSSKGISRHIAFCKGKAKVSNVSSKTAKVAVFFLIKLTLL